jgi:hypothetical protein
VLCAVVAFSAVSHTFFCTALHKILFISYMKLFRNLRRDIIRDLVIYEAE